MSERAMFEFLDHIRDNLVSVRAMLEADPVFVRNRAAESGMELTPQECDHLLELLRAGYSVIGGDTQEA